MSPRTPSAQVTERNDVRPDRSPIPAEYLRDWGAMLSAADRACCCTARPVVTAVLPLTDEHPDPVGLLLCGHHFRVHRTRLAAEGAVVFDADGNIVTTSTQKWLFV